MDDYKVIDHYLCVKLPREVDHHKSEEICKNADRLIATSDVNHVIFDFEDTTFMDSSGVGIIIGRYKKIAPVGGKVYAIHADQQIRRILKMSGLNKIIEIMDEEKN